MRYASGDSRNRLADFRTARSASERRATRRAHAAVRTRRDVGAGAGTATQSASAYPTDDLFDGLAPLKVLLRVRSHPWNERVATLADQAGTRTQVELPDPLRLIRHAEIFSRHSGHLITLHPVTAASAARHCFSP